MPFDKTNSLWTLESVSPLNALAEKEIVILTGDQNYCFDCYYLIGIHTRYNKAVYNLEVKSIDATKEYSNLLRVGDNKLVKMVSKK